MGRPNVRWVTRPQPSGAMCLSPPSRIGLAVAHHLPILLWQPTPPAPAATRGRGGASTTSPHHCPLSVYRRPRCLATLLPTAGLSPPPISFYCWKCGSPHPQQPLHVLHHSRPPLSPPSPLSRPMVRAGRAGTLGAARSVAVKTFWTLIFFSWHPNLF
jgi:hypothetical protein